jgi:hypothetical protein
MSRSTLIVRERDLLDERGEFMRSVITVRARVRECVRERYEIVVIFFFFTKYRETSRFPIKQK